MTTYKGACHCHAVEWTLELPEPKHVLCHCNTCKLLSGSAFSLNSIVPRSALALTKGESSLHDYVYKGDSGKSVHCYFCQNCGSHVYHHQESMGPDTIIAKTMNLEGAKDFLPAAEVYGKARLPWVKEVAQTFEMMPPS